MRIFLAAYAGVATLLILVVRVWIVFRQTGVWPIAPLRADDLQGFVSRSLLVTGGLMGVSVVLFVVGGSAYGWVVPLEAWVRAEIQFAAVVVLLGSLAWVFIAQAQMRRSWRIGVDAASQTDLVTRGLFAWSRNPVFLGIRGMLLGEFLAHPNVLSLLAAVIGNVLIEVQVRLEERHLEQVHGDAYRAYRGAVGRWWSLPRVG